MEKLFLLTGMGADYRLFKHLDLTGFEVIHVHYFDPAKDDSLETYADKLIDRYGITDDTNVLGVSLGGMLTVEIARRLKLKNAIVISSMTLRTEAPAYQAFFRTFPLYKLIPATVMWRVGFLLKPFFSKKMGGESQLFNLMLKNTSPWFLKWAMGAALKWNPKPLDKPIHQLIGDADLVFNYKRLKNAAVLTGGDHMMVFTRGKEVTGFIKGVLLK